MNNLIVTEKSNISAIADAVRNKTGSTETLSMSGMIELINEFNGGESGGIDTSDATATVVIGSMN